MYHTGDSWGRYLCFCDSGCSQFGDCCIDNMKELLPRPDKIKGFKKDHWGCIPTGNVFGVRGIVSCSGYSELSKLCSKTVFSGVNSDLAVIDKSSQVVFANVFCALCHLIKPVDIVFTNQTILCRPFVKNMTGLTYRDLIWKNEINADDKSTTQTVDCYLKLNGFPSDTRLCYPVLIDSCPDLSSNLTQPCLSYSQPVQNTSSGKSYANPHCALCHGENPKHLSCMNPFSSKLGSLITIFDFDWDFKRCDWPNNVWDGDIGICRPLDCLLNSCVIAKEDNLNKSQLEGFNNIVEGYITLAVLALSIFFLLLHNGIYYSESKRHNVPSHILKNLSWSIIFGHVSFLLIDTKLHIAFCFCKIIGFSTQFFYMVSFFWMNVMSYDIWRTFSKVSVRGSSSSILLKYNIYTYGFSLSFILITLISDSTDIVPSTFRPNIGLDKLCWFGNKFGLAIYFYIPIILILLINLFFFGRTVIWFQKQTSKEFEKSNNEATGRKEYHKLWLYIKLCVIMGLTWLFCIVASLTKSQILRYIFIICNGLQGAILFIMFDMKKATIDKLVSSFRSRTSWTSSSSDLKILQTKDITATQISHNVTSQPLKINSLKNCTITDKPT